MSAKAVSLTDSISIHALREESDLRVGVSGGDRLISIHALREESDIHLLAHGTTQVISIHALREESDSPAIRNVTPRRYFNPRSP